MSHKLSHAARRRRAGFPTWLRIGPPVTAATLILLLTPALAGTLPGHETIEWARYDTAFVVLSVGLVAGGGMVGLLWTQLARLAEARRGRALARTTARG